MKKLEWREANLSEEEIATLLTDTCCLVHPSLNDSFGVVVLKHWQLVVL